MPSNRWFGTYPKPPITLCRVFTRTPQNGVSSGVNMILVFRHQVCCHAELVSASDQHGISAPHGIDPETSSGRQPT